MGQQQSEQRALAFWGQQHRACCAMGLLFEATLQCGKLYISLGCVRCIGIWCSIVHVVRGMAG